MDKGKLIEWLNKEYMNEGISHDRARAYMNVLHEIESGAFDTDESPIIQERNGLREAITRIGQIVTKLSYSNASKVFAVSEIVENILNTVPSGEDRHEEPKMCTSCSGTGIYDSTDMSACGTCDGTGLEGGNEG